jgi:hypothetical protein
MPDFLPSRDSELVTWSNTFSAFLTATPTVVGITAAQATAYAALNSSWLTSYATANAALTRSPANIITKNSVRKALTISARQLAKIIQGYPGTTDAQRAELGLTIPAVPTPVPVPSAAPNIDIVSRTGTTVRIKLHDGTGTKRGKPAGVAGASVYSYVGATPPSTGAGWTFEGNTTRTEIDVQFAATLVPGTIVWLTACWYNPRGQSGQGCTPLSAILAGGGMSLAA